MLLGELKTGLSACMKKVQATGHPLIITRNGRPPGVLLSPVEYDNLVLFAPMAAPTTPAEIKRDRRGWKIRVDVGSVIHKTKGWKPERYRCYILLRNRWHTLHRYAHPEIGLTLFCQPHRWEAGR